MLIIRFQLSVDNLLHRRHGEWDEGELTLPRGIPAGLGVAVLKRRKSS